MLIERTFDVAIDLELPTQRQPQSGRDQQSLVAQVGCVGGASANMRPEAVQKLQGGW